MAKYVLVDKKPEELKKGEYYISEPNFMEQVLNGKRLLSVNKLTGTNYIRAIVHGIAEKYDRNLNGMKIKPHNYVGRKIENDEQAHKLFIDLLMEQWPSIMDSYIDFHIKKMPFGTEIIYFDGTHLRTAAFTANGIHEIKQDEVKDYLDKKSTSKPLNKSQQRVVDMAKKQAEEKKETEQL